ncbi:hypothetical protein PR001_g10076 [Phytophthora rubi]|uniref:Secreted protein n=1 Tax=Phytophthora rubi TaxID=129364 RepID=A0A6A3MQH1_9STRA|nr:hypothetical protein PR001_g10076 [Phytophthora rubi]
MRGHTSLLLRLSVALRTPCWCKRIYGKRRINHQASQIDGSLSAFSCCTCSLWNPVHSIFEDYPVVVEKFVAVRSRSRNVQSTWNTPRPGPQVAPKRTSLPANSFRSKGLMFSDFSLTVCWLAVTLPCHSRGV